MYQFDKQAYIQAYSAIVKNVLDAAKQLQLQHFILHPFGMGAYLRKLHMYVEGWEEKSDKKNQLRRDMVTTIYKLQQAYPEITFYICYPKHQENSHEDTTNAHAFESQFGVLQNVRLYGGTDAFALANHLTKYDLEVGMLNAANAYTLGNDWRSENRAHSAIDENIHRRSYMLCLTSHILEVNLVADFVTMSVDAAAKYTAESDILQIGSNGILWNDGRVYKAR